MTHVVRGPGPPAGRLSSANATLPAGSRPLAGSHLANAITPPDAGAFWLAIYPSLPAARAKARLVTRADSPSRHRACANSRKGGSTAGAIARQRLVTLVGRSVRSVPVACRRTAYDVPVRSERISRVRLVKKRWRNAGCGHAASSSSLLIDHLSSHVQQLTPEGWRIACLDPKGAYHPCAKQESLAQCRRDHAAGGSSFWLNTRSITSSSSSSENGLVM